HREKAEIGLVSYCHNRVMVLTNIWGKNIFFNLLSAAPEGTNYAESIFVYFFTSISHWKTKTLFCFLLLLETIKKQNSEKMRLQNGCRLTLACAVLCQPQNILLTSSCPLGDVKIVDFGLSRRVSSHHELREIMGTPEYVAPEILNYEPISTATDMWSIGVLAYVMLTGISPFLGNNKQETFLNISQLNVSYGAEELQQLDQDALSFIQMLLRRQPHITSSSTRSAPPASSSSIAEEEESEEGEAAMTEELIILAAYTLDQGHQSSSSTSKEVMLAADQKAISQRFRFEILQRPGERLHLLTPTSTHI
uniref:Protein kinase domain-containing protein n=1 Tax=Xiphophorus couchianus TaxID=32473 RepID=A0A3B5LKL0_9TELE